MPVPDWLVNGKPIAHRGLHGVAGPENSWGAFRAALDEGYPIEFDLQLTLDSKYLVFHDRNLKRMTGKSLTVTSHPLSLLQRHHILGTNEPPPSFVDLLSEVNGVVPLVIEVKPAKIRHKERATRVLEEIKDYDGPLVLQSFDARIVYWLKYYSNYPVGLIVGRYRDPSAPKEFRRRLEERWLAEAAEVPRSMAPDFIAHDIKRLTTKISERVREKNKVPLITWTVNNKDKEDRAILLADNYIFDAIQPNASLLK